MYPVSLTGDRIRLREFTEDDVPSALRVVGDTRVTDWLSFDAKTTEQTHSMLSGVVQRAQAEPRTEYYLAVTSLDGALIGFARLGLAGVEAAKLGFAIAADEWGHGYATDAAKTLINFGFRVLKLHRISAAVGPENAASLAIVARLGFQPEGRIRHHVYTNGEWRDSLLFSLLYHEWTTQAP
jgi:[ribosomal protein S5]-alanine N-acetyltransferase